MFIDYSDPDNVVIKYKDKVIKGKIYFSKNFNQWWLHVDAVSNNYPFEVLNINYQEFITNILGYNLGDHCVNSREDLIKVLDALNKEYDKKFGKSSSSLNPEDLEDGDFIYLEDSVANFRGIYIFKAFKNGFIHRHAYYHINESEVKTNFGVREYTSNTTIRKASTNEIVLMQQALKKEGLYWNIITKSIENLPPKLLTIEHPVTPTEATVYSWNQIKKPFAESLKDIVNSSVDQTININNFITKNKHYQLNFNN